MKIEKNTIFSSKDQHNNLLKSKLKTIGFFEKFSMWFRGRRDGKAGIPREDAQGNWTSPSLMQEEHMLHEMSDKLWGSTQLELEEDYISVSVLLEEIEKIESQLYEMNQKRPLEPDVDYFKHRRGAEERLTVGQVQSRREAELRKQNASYYSQLATFGNQLQAKYEELFYKRSHISEVNNATRLISERMKYHVEQRRTVYWNAVLRVHPDKDRLPALLKDIEDSKTELTYLSAHKELEETISEMLTRKGRLTELKFGFQEEDK